MNKIITSLMALGFPFWLQAQPGEKWVLAEGTYLKSRDCGCLKPTVGLGMGAGVWLSGRWGWEMSLLHTQLKSSEGSQKAQEAELFSSVLFKLVPDGAKVVPYLKAGLGGAHIESPYSLGPEATTRLAFQAGLGFHYILGPHSLANLEVRATNIQTSERRVEYQGVAGLGFRWGSAKAAPRESVLVAPVLAPVPVPPPLPAEASPLAAPPLAAPVHVESKALVLGQTKVYSNVYFGNNQSGLKPDAIKALKKVAQAVMAAPARSRTVMITGHASKPGTRAHNQALSLKRAKAVAKVLRNEGIAADHLTVTGRGSTQPKATNKTKAGQAKNRRVQIEIKTAGGKAPKP